MDVERRLDRIAVASDMGGGRPQLPDLSELWARFPSVPGDSGRFLEEDR